MNSKKNNTCTGSLSKLLAFGPSYSFHNNNKSPEEYYREYYKKMKFEMLESDTCLVFIKNTVSRWLKRSVVY